MVKAMTKNMKNPFVVINLCIIGICGISQFGLATDNTVAMTESTSANEQPQFGVGLTASDITGTGFLLKQYLNNSREINYTLYVAHEERKIEAEGLGSNQLNSTADFGLSYRQEIGSKKTAQSTFSSIRGGWFLGGHASTNTNLSLPRKQSDISAIQGAFGGGIYVGVDINLFRLEGSAGLRYLENQSRKWIDEFSLRGKEVIRNFTVGGGISLTYGF